MLRVSRVVAVFLLVFLPGCRSESQGDSKPKGRTERALLEVRVGGEIRFSFKEKVDLRIVTIESPVKDVRFLSVGITDHVRAGPNERFRIAFDLVGQYEGAGDYVIPQAKQTPQASSGSSSVDLTNTYLLFARIKDDASPITRENLETVMEFNLPVDPCRIRVAAQVAGGRMVCPTLATSDGRHVELEMKWKLL